MPERKLTPEILSAALKGLEAQRDRVASQIAEVRRLLGGAHAPASSAAEAPTRKPRRKMSAAARKRITEAQRKRWEAFRKTSEPVPAPARKQIAKTAKAAPTQKRTMSAAGRKRIAEAARKRWAEFRKAAAKP